MAKEMSGVEALIHRVEAGEISPAEACRRLARPGADTPARPAAMRELDALIGLSRVKLVVQELYAFIQVQQWRRQAGLKADNISLHMLFTGNPGTGKTTVARLLGGLFREMGLLSRGHLVEAERADLVGEWVGHTAVKTREVIKKALGGILFVDEAYSLARGGERDFGREAIDCLVKWLEDQRQNLVVVLAGYPAEMEWFLAHNPGLASRLPVRIDFPDYTPAELLAIARHMAGERQYALTPEAESALSAHLSLSRTAARGGNARFVRNLLERAMRCQAVRLTETTRMHRDDLLRLERADIERALQGDRPPLT